MNVLFLKTRPENIAGVLASKKHASCNEPKDKPALGDMILIAQTASDTRPPRFLYAVRFLAFYEEETGDSERTWGPNRRAWKYVFEWYDLHDLGRGFGTQELSAPQVDYDRVHTIGYLYKEDILEFKRMGVWKDLPPLRVPGGLTVGPPPGARFVCLNCRDTDYPDKQECPACRTEWIPLLHWDDMDGALRHLGEDRILAILDRTDPLSPWDREARHQAVSGSSRDEIASAQLNFARARI